MNIGPACGAKQVFMFERNLASDALDHSDGLRVATFHLKAVHKKSDTLD